MATLSTKNDHDGLFAERGKREQSPSGQSQTVWSATCDLLRALKLTTFFGNPGSTELPFLKPLM
jgi:hypothetical protein